MPNIDLHIHSCASDGEWTPEAIIRQIDDHAIKVFAVTDHDEIGSVKRLAELTKDRSDLQYIKGVEISATYEGQEFHILTYGIDETNPILLEILRKNRQVRDDYNDHLIEHLNASYPEVSINSYRSYDYDPNRGGWLTYAYLLDLGIIKDLPDYFHKTNDFHQDKVFHHPKELIASLNALGYTTVLAHPPAYTSGDLYLEANLDLWRSFGIQGIECYCQYLKDQENSAYYVAYCQKHQLKITGGSDCHGNFAGRRLGHPKVTDDMVSKIW